MYGQYAPSDCKDRGKMESGRRPLSRRAALRSAIRGTCPCPKLAIIKSLLESFKLTNPVEVPLVGLAAGFYPSEREKKAKHRKEQRETRTATDYANTNKQGRIGNKERAVPLPKKPQFLFVMAERQLVDLKGVAHLGPRALGKYSHFASVETFLSLISWTWSGRRTWMRFTGGWRSQPSEWKRLGWATIHFTVVPHSLLEWFRKPSPMPPALYQSSRYRSYYVRGRIVEKVVLFHPEAPGKVWLC